MRKGLVDPPSSALPKLMPDSGGDDEGSQALRPVETDVDLSRQLQQVIDVSEARSLSLSGSSTSLRGSINGLSKSNDVDMLRKALKTRELTLKTLDALNTSSREEASEWQSAQLRSLNAWRLISSLPHELLARIFELACICNIDDERSLSNDIRTLRRVRGAISLTCFRWRRIALQTATLWGTISIVIHDPPDNVNADDEDNWIDTSDSDHNDNNGSDEDVEDSSLCHTRVNPDRSLLTLELQRAGDLPLTIHLRSFSPHSSKELHIASQVMSRCETAYLFLTVHERKGAMLCAPQPLPMLRTLTLALSFRSDKDARSTEAKPAPVDLTQAASLRNLNLWRDFPLQRSMIPVELPSSNNITRLGLNEAVPITALALVHKCPCLASLMWDSGDGYDGAVSQVNDTKPLPHLRILHLTGCSAPQYLEYFDAPGLEALVIDQRSAASQYRLSRVASEFPRLRFVKIMSKFIIRKEIASFLRAHPLLEEIVLGCSLDNSLVKGLGSVTSTGFGLLYLQRLWVDYEPTSSYDDTEFRYALELLRLRNAAHTTQQDSTIDSVEREELGSFCLYFNYNQYSSGLIGLATQYSGKVKFDRKHHWHKDPKWEEKDNTVLLGPPA